MAIRNNSQSAYLPSSISCDTNFTAIAYIALTQVGTFTQSELQAKVQHYDDSVTVSQISQTLNVLRHEGLIYIADTMPDTFYVSAYPARYEKAAQNFLQKNFKSVYKKSATSTATEKTLSKSGIVSGQVVTTTYTYTEHDSHSTETNEKQDPRLPS